MWDFSAINLHLHSTPTISSNILSFLPTLFLLSLIKSNQVENNFNEEIINRMTRYQFSIIHLKDKVSLKIVSSICYLQKYLFSFYFCHHFQMNNNLFLSANLFFCFKMWIFWGHWVRWSCIRHSLWSWSWTPVDFNGCWRQ